MDPESIVYGCIRDCPDGDPQARRVRRLHNRRMLDELPELGSLSLLSRQMFSFCRFEGEGLYQTQVIHFGASYRAVEYEWAAWLKQFESLLGRLYWSSAVVHLDTELRGFHTFRWESEQGFHHPGEGVLRMRCAWEHEGGLRG